MDDFSSMNIYVLVHKCKEKVLSSLQFILEIPFICVWIWHSHKHSSLFTSVNEAPPARFLVLPSEISSAQTTLCTWEDIKMLTLHKNKHTDNVNVGTSISGEHTLKYSRGVGGILFLAFF